MMSSLHLPYFAPDPPCALPTETEIAQSPILIDHNGYKVARVGTHFIVKYGNSKTLNLLEGENMVFVQQNTRIKVPRVYALYMNDAATKSYIVMEYIEGDTLEAAWPLLSEAEKEKITGILKGYFIELRKLLSPGYYGSIGKRPLLQGMFWTPKSIPEINGPFDTEEEFNNAMVLKFTRDSDFSSKNKAEFYKQAMRKVLTGNKPTFTHGDFRRKNVMIRRVASDETPDGEFEVTLLDWEMSGWYSGYWEYSISMVGTGWADDWSRWLAEVLGDSHVVEFPWVQMLFLDLWS